MNIRIKTRSQITPDIMKLIHNELDSIEGLSGKEFEVWTNAEMDSVLIELRKFMRIQDVGSGSAEILDQIRNNTLDALNKAGIQVIRQMEDDPISL